MLRFDVIKWLCLIVLVLLFILDGKVGIPKMYYAIPIGVFIVLTILGSFFIQWNFHLKSLHSNPEGGKDQVALTFDDGPHPEYTPQVLELLEQFNAKATFFCIGKHMESYPGLVQKIIDAGHTIGNHTYSHNKAFGFFGTTRVVSELKKTNEIFNGLTKKQMLLYRPAFGVTNPNIQKAVRVLGLQSIGWSVRSLDTTNLSETVIFNRIINRLSEGDIILLHDTRTKTLAVLERLLLILQEKNSRSVTVDKLLNIQAYA